MQTSNNAMLPSDTAKFKDWAVSVRKSRPPASMKDYISGWREFFDHYAQQFDVWNRRNLGYHADIKKLMAFYVAPNSRVLDIGCSTGDLLSAVKPAYGVGIDISSEMVRIAKAKHSGFTFLQMAAEELDLPDQQFDYIILSDMIGFFFDIQQVFRLMRQACNQHTRIIIHWHSRLWQPALKLAERLGLKYPQPLLNWTTQQDVQNLLYLTDYEIVGMRKFLLVPKRVPLLSTIANRYLAQLPLLRHLCVTNWIIARPLGLADTRNAPKVSVICPCRNEAGNIEQIALRLPKMGAHTELIFVEGHSQDGTLAECNRVKDQVQEDIKVFVQQGKGKGDAVRLGFSKAEGDILMILDADLSVLPEDLPQFYEAIASGRGEFINGSRLVYLMDPKAMRFLNLLGNKFFASLLSRLLGQTVKDTLCGTKVIWRSRYEELARGRAYFGDFDPFGDFDLLFGAAKLHLRIVEIPVRYRERTYGSTNIRRFSDGFMLLRMCLVAARRLYFVN
jgi:ubiquinone/menaquinone biosynthesis C-methylase UbiE